MSARDRQWRNNGTRHALRGKLGNVRNSPGWLFIMRAPDSCYYLLINSLLTGTRSA